MGGMVTRWVCWATSSSRGFRISRGEFDWALPKCAAAAVVGCRPKVRGYLISRNAKVLFVSVSEVSRGTFGSITRWFDQWTPSI